MSASRAETPRGRPPSLRRSLRLLCLLLCAGAAAASSGCKDPVGPQPAFGTPPPPTAPPKGAPLPPSDADLAASLRAEVEALASPAMAGRDDSTDGGRAARAHVVARLRGCGIPPLLPEGYSQPIDGLPDAANILGLLPGADPTLRARALLLSAHHDHVGPCTPKGEVCLGADDNAAAVATVLHVACALAASGGLRRGLVVATWDAEEPPTFLTPQMGSQFFTDHPPLPLASLDLAVVLDLVGGSLWPDFPGHTLLGAEHSAALSALVDALPKPASLQVVRLGLHLIEHTPYGHHAWSDYDAFRAAGVPFLFLSNGQNKRYHTPADLPSALDYPKMAAQARLLLDLLRAVDASPTPLDFSLSREDHLHDARAVLALLDAALAPTSGLIDRLGLSPAARLRLSADRRAVAAIAARADSADSASPPTPLSAADIQTLRTSTQRVMCLCGPYAPELVCLAL